MIATLPPERRTGLVILVALAVFLGRRLARPSPDLSPEPLELEKRHQDRHHDRGGSIAATEPTGAES